MLISPETRDRVSALAQQTLPKQFQGDLSFVTDLIFSTLETHTDPDQARSQLTTELTTYFEASTAQVVSALLAEAVPRKDNATIFLRKVPKHLNTIEQLSTYFQEFGQVLNVQVFPNKNSAQVCFAAEESAAAALASPTPVLNCKFIRLAVFRQKHLKPEAERRTKTKLAARELDLRRKQLSADKTKTVQALLKVLNERKEELSEEQQKALIAQIRLLGADVAAIE